jgi:hypothetical protein
MRSPWTAFRPKLRPPGTRSTAAMLVNFYRFLAMER